MIDSLDSGYNLCFEFYCAIPWGGGAGAELKGFVVLERLPCFGALLRNKLPVYFLYLSETNAAYCVVL